MSMLMPLSSRIIFIALGILMPVGAHLADFNATHIFNPDWPPHAKFHGAQTLMLSVLLGGMTILVAWRRTADRLSSIIAASGFASLYWISQGAAALYPGTAFFDPRFDTPDKYLLGLADQLWIELLFLSLTALAAWLALRPGARWVK
jgi:hypothetical protein